MVGGIFVRRIYLASKHMKDAPDEGLKKAGNAARNIQKIRAKKKGRSPKGAAAVIAAVQDPKGFMIQLIWSAVSAALPNIIIIVVIIALPLALFSFLFDDGSNTYEETYQKLSSEVNEIFSEKFAEALDKALQQAEQRKEDIISTYSLDEFNPAFECLSSGYDIRYNVSLLLCMYSWSYQAGGDTSDGYLTSEVVDGAPEDVEMNVDYKGDKNALMRVVKKNANDLWEIHIAPAASEDLSGFITIREDIKRDTDGNPIQATDSYGNLQYDSEGNPVYETETKRVMEGVTITYSVTIKPNVTEIFREHFELSDEDFAVAQDQAENLNIVMNTGGGMYAAGGAVADIIMLDAQTAEDTPLDYMLIGPAVHWVHNTSDEYGNRMLNGEPDFHNGLDIGRGNGSNHDSEVIGSGNGRVVDVESTLPTFPDNTGNSYGNYVLAYYGRKQVNVDGASMYVKVYALTAHMRSVDVSPGSNFSTGQVLGLIGESGNAYGEHIHFVIFYYNEDTQEVFHTNPRNELGY